MLRNIALTTQLSWSDGKVVVAHGCVLQNTSQLVRNRPQVVHSTCFARAACAHTAGTRSCKRAAGPALRAFTKCARSFARDSRKAASNAFPSGLAASPAG